MAGVAVAAVDAAAAADRDADIGATDAGDIDADVACVSDAADCIVFFRRPSNERRIELCRSPTHKARLLEELMPVAVTVSPAAFASSAAFACFLMYSLNEVDCFRLLLLLLVVVVEFPLLRLWRLILVADLKLWWLIPVPDLPHCPLSGEANALQGPVLPPAVPGFRVGLVAVDVRILPLRRHLVAECRTVSVAALTAFFGQEMATR